MKIEDFLYYDASILASLSDDDLRAIASSGRKIANQRIMRLKKSNALSAPAFTTLPKQVRESGFQTRGLSRSQLMTTIKTQQQFIRSRSSTITGWEQMKERTAAKVNETMHGRKKRFGFSAAGHLVLLKPGISSEMTARQVNRFWELYSRIKQDPIRAGSLGSSQIQEVIYNVIKQHPNMKTDNLDLLLPSDMGAAYEQLQEERRQAADDIISGDGVTIS